MKLSDLGIDNFIFECYPLHEVKGIRLDGMDICVRLTYIPTGAIFESCSERSQHRNKENVINEFWRYYESICR